jgi:hypothetical protein
MFKDPPTFKKLSTYQYVSGIFIKIDGVSTSNGGVFTFIMGKDNG